MREFNPYRLTKPCHDCPFRNDRPGYLTKARVEEIWDSLVTSGFPCHKTTVHVMVQNPDDPDEFEDDVQETENSQQCAGMLILLEKQKKPSQLMQVMERLDVYHPEKLDMSQPVYDSWDEMIEAQRD